MCSASNLDWHGSTRPRRIFSPAKCRCATGMSLVDRLTPRFHGELSGALLHHWRGTAFAPGARAVDFERLLRDFNSYPRTFAPQVLQARVAAEDASRQVVSMRVRQKHVITVVLDASYDVNFGRLDEKHGFSISRSTSDQQRSTHRERRRSMRWRPTRSTVFFGG